MAKIKCYVCGPSRACAHAGGKAGIGRPFTGAALTVAQAAEVRLPVIPLSPRAGSASYLDISERTMEDAVGQYLALMVGRARKDGESGARVWTCGCRIGAYDSVSPCDRHAPALRDYKPIVKSYRAPAGGGARA